MFHKIPRQYHQPVIKVVSRSNKKAMIIVTDEGLRTLHLQPYTKDTWISHDHRLWRLPMAA
ncbi:hypothetical protein FWF48_02155 [Candidatus Saccharibacteria bacterium]|nr:hypothetical protein [Candidatus Saccharibacteria bacterium]